ncbi:transglutaminase family protein [Eionea flava]
MIAKNNNTVTDSSKGIFFQRVQSDSYVGDPSVNSRPLMISLLIAYSSVCLLHFSQLPALLLVASPLIIAWRIQILREKMAPPNRLVKTCFSLVFCLFLFFYYKQWVAVEPTVGLLLVASSLKLLEIRHRRDIFVIAFLYFFLVACGFLFKQSLIYSAASALVTVLITAVLVLLYSSQQGGIQAAQPTSYVIVNSIKLSAKLLFQSVFLAAVILLLFPRLNPLWSVPIHSDQATTGISDSMSPGDISSLIQDPSLAFRVTFVDDVIDRQDMYWRGLVFDDFDGRRWQRSQSVEQTVRLGNKNATRISSSVLNKPDVRPIDYDVLLEATTQQWLYAVPNARVIQGVRSPIYSNASEIFQENTINQRIQYRVSTNTAVANTDPLSTIDYRRFTALPSSSNPKTQRLALQWWQESSSPEAYIDQVLTYYRKNFQYTLSPPPLGFHTVDEFLFDTQSGFCEHFSSSFTVLMRSVGIPARVVVGYHGGEWNSDQSYVNVYQRDAHAWAEVWLKNKGWIRVDPTAAVAFSRIEQGVSAALPQRERSLVGGNRSTQLEWVKKLHQQWQNIDYRWQRWVVSYDNEAQQNLLEKYFGEMTIGKVITVVTIPLVVVALIISFSLFRESFIARYFQRASAEEKIYLRLIKKLKAKGVEIKDSDSVSTVCQKAIVAFPQHQALLEGLCKDINALFYRSSIDQKERKRYRLNVEQSLKLIV